MSNKDKIIRAMAEEISSLRWNDSLEWGEVEDKDYYNVEKIIEEFEESIENE